MISSESFKAIADLDLEPIKVKLMHVESGEGWSLEKVNAVEFEYRRFLYLMKMFPNEQTAPLMDVDIFWHYHILDTMKYAIDCEKVFGYFLHHFPYIGLRGEDDEEAHERVGNRMKELYEETFGEDYLRADTAYSGRVASPLDFSPKTAYSGRVSVAYSGRVAAQTAYSGRVAGEQVAYSGRVAGEQVAYSGRVAGQQVAYSGRVAAEAKTAYSGRVAGE
ncbi:MAG TPA: glycine-rich domain-containing protein-like, partial [Pseudoduganella sp.]